MSSALVRGRLMWWRFVRVFAGGQVISSAFVDVGFVDVDVELGSQRALFWLAHVDVELGVSEPSFCWHIFTYLGICSFSQQCYFDLVIFLRLMGSH